MELYPFDDEYVRRLREGDRETAGHFHSYFRDLLQLKLRRRLPSAEAVDEVRQEVFLRVLERLGDLRDGRKLGAFVNATANNVLLEHYRAERRADPLDESSAAELLATGDADAQVDAERTRERVRRVLAQLPPREAEILCAAFLDEGDKEEVCRRYGVDRPYLRVLLHRAKEKFRAQYTRRKSGRLEVSETFGDHKSLPK